MMAVNSCARRKTDGLLTWPQSSPQMPSASAVQENAARRFGGVAADYELVTLTDEQLTTVRAGIPGRAFASKDEFDQVTAVTVPRTPTLTSDKAQIADDGLDEAVITFDTTDGTFTGDVTFIVSAPDGTRQTVVKAAVAGVATLTLSTLLTGNITIDARADLFGDGLMTVEGI